MFPATLGFLSNRDSFTDEAIIKEYEKYAVSQRKKLLPEIFKQDMVSAIVFYANAGKITVKNFEEEYLTPAQNTNATQCVSFLLDWLNQNITQEAKEKHFERELTKDPFNAADMKKLWNYSKLEDGTLIIKQYKGTDTEIEIPERIGTNAVTTIADEAFIDRKDLTSITIPDSVTSIGERAFCGCQKLANQNGFVIIRNVLYGYFGNASNAVIPEGVTSICTHAFYECSGLTSITIPDSVTNIGNGAFYGCKSLTSITIPDGVTSIGFETFKKCNNLTSITIPDSVTSIGTMAFHNCSNLTSITIPDSITSIGFHAFYNCSRLTSLTIPNSVTSIGDSAFSGCNKLTNIIFPNSVTEICIEVFNNCRSLTSITIPNSVTSIGGGAFHNCKSLTSIAIPDSVTSIGYEAFDGCENLVIHAPAGSYAEIYARQEDIPFVAE